MIVVVGVSYISLTDPCSVILVDFFAFWFAVALTSLNIMFFCEPCRPRVILALKIFTAMQEKH